MRTLKQSLQKSEAGYKVCDTCLEYATRYNQAHNQKTLLPASVSIILCILSKSLFMDQHKDKLVFRWAMFSLCSTRTLDKFINVIWIYFQLFNQFLYKISSYWNETGNIYFGLCKLLQNLLTNNKKYLFLYIITRIRVIGTNFFFYHYSNSLKAFWSIRNNIDFHTAAAVLLEYPNDMSKYAHTSF